MMTKDTQIGTKVMKRRGQLDNITITQHTPPMTILVGLKMGSRMMHRLRSSHLMLINQMAQTNVSHPHLQMRLKA
jgi:hypothetical protein